jgi:hypothetical protein
MLLEEENAVRSDGSGLHFGGSEYQKRGRRVGDEYGPKKNELYDYN